jgi:uncharacterized membrane protein
MGKYYKMRLQHFISTCKNQFRKGLRRIVQGVFFLVPVALTGLLFGKLFSLLQAVLHPLLRPMEDITIIGFALKELIAMLVLLIICFLIGLLASTKPAKDFISRIERSILKLVPGYDFIKSLGSSFTGVKEKNTEIVLVKVTKAWQLAFLIEQVDENLYAVFIPAVPSMWSGELYYINRERIKETSITKKQAMNCIRQLGFGSAEIMKNSSGIQFTHRPKVTAAPSESVKRTQ